MVVRVDWPSRELIKEIRRRLELVATGVTVRPKTPKIESVDLGGGVIVTFVSYPRSLQVFSVTPNLLIAASQELGCAVNGYTSTDDWPADLFGIEVPYQQQTN